MSLLSNLQFLTMGGYFLIVAVDVMISVFSSWVIHALTTRLHSIPHNHIECATVNNYFNALKRNNT